MADPAARTSKRELGLQNYLKKLSIIEFMVRQVKLGSPHDPFKNRTLSRKPSKFSDFHKRAFVKWILVERKILRLFLSKPSFRRVPKGKGDLKGSLAYDF